MRISELSRQSGVAIPTIKYYIREGLLARGERTAANQARYAASHLARLRLIRTLREVADLPVATISEVIAALEEPEAAARADHISTALGAVSRRDRPATPEARATVAALTERLGWDVDPGSGGYQDLAAALSSLDEHWKGVYTLEGLERYARVAEQLAAMEIPEDWHPTDADSLSYAVLGTILFEPVILSLRRLAHEDRHRRLTTPEPSGGS
jgi:DNA-binding transcriptional MerR regulator